MLKQKKIILSLVSGFLLALGWPPLPTAFLLMLGLLPLLIIHQQYLGNSRPHFKLWRWAYLSMLIFNSSTTWWVWNASPSGCIMMLLANSLIMSLPFLLFSFTNKLLPKTGHWSLVFYYMAIEYVHFNWSASWPWLTLGKGLAAFPFFIQWYEFTGEMGGTFLILIFNVWFFKIIVNQVVQKIWQPILGLILIYVFSILLMQRSELKPDSAKAIECVISQPNINPYTEKFSDGENYIDAQEQLRLGLDVAKPFITPQTTLLVLPETAITGWNQESELNQSSLLKPVRQMTDSTGLTILSGAETVDMYRTAKKPTLTARYDSFSNVWWDCYNTALLFQNNKVDSIYHKSRLVPGVEKMPFEFLEQLSINLGGTSGSLGVSKIPINFVVTKHLKIAPLICYESVFGDYAAEFVRDSANALAVITNDGWWGNTPGFKQHLLFGAIRCIETRKEMLRSANTGVSAKIDVFGNISHATKYNERIAFKCSIVPNDIHTFYVRNGNLIGKLSCWIAGIFLSISVVIAFRKNKLPLVSNPD